MNKGNLVKSNLFIHFELFKDYIPWRSENLKKKRKILKRKNSPFLSAERNICAMTFVSSKMKSFSENDLHASFSMLNKA